MSGYIDSYRKLRASLTAVDNLCGWIWHTGLISDSNDSHSREQSVIPIPSGERYVKLSKTDSAVDLYLSFRQLLSGEVESALPIVSPSSSSQSIEIKVLHIFI